MTDQSNSEQAGLTAGRFVWMQPDSPERIEIRRRIAGLLLLVVVPCLGLAVAQRSALRSGGLLVAMLALLMYVGPRPLRRFESVVISILLLPGLAVPVYLLIVDGGPEYSYWAFPMASVLFFTVERIWAISGTLIVAAIVATGLHRLGESVASIHFLGTFVLIAAMSGAAMLTIGRYQRRLNVLAETDALTGLLNRTKLDAAMSAALSSVMDTQASVALILVDIDHFKFINDQLGHAFGDDVIVAVADELQRLTPDDATVYRFGGEEFLVIAPQTRNGAVALGRTYRAGIAHLELGHELAVTVSVGIALARPDDTPRIWLSRADRALYRAKEAGRNRVASID